MVLFIFFGTETVKGVKENECKGGRMNKGQRERERERERERDSERERGHLIVDSGREVNLSCHGHRKKEPRINLDFHQVGLISASAVPPRTKLWKKSLVKNVELA